MKHFHGVLEDDHVTLFENNRRKDESYSLSDVKLVAPVNPSKIVCVGRNYAEHAAELGNEVADRTAVVSEGPFCPHKHGDKITLPKYSKQVEHEGELAMLSDVSCRIAV